MLATKESALAQKLEELGSRHIDTTVPVGVQLLK